MNLKQKGNTTIYISLVVLVLIVLLLGLFILSKQSVPIQTDSSAPVTQKAGTETVPKSINTEKIFNFGNSIQNFNLKQDSYQQAQITLFNSGTVTEIGTENLTDEGVDYTHFLKLVFDESEELTYRFTSSEISTMLVILARQGAGGGEKIGFGEIEAGDDVSVQRVIDLLEGSTGDEYTLSVRRQ